MFSVYANIIWLFKLMPGHVLQKGKFLISFLVKISTEILVDAI